MSIRKSIIAGSVVAAVAVIGGVLLLLRDAGGDTAGTQAPPKNEALNPTGVTTPPKNAALDSGRVTGPGAQALLDMLGITMPSRASAGSFSVAPGFTIDSMMVRQADDGSIEGTAQVTIGGSGLQLGMDVVFSDATTWSFTATAAAGRTFTPTSGITIDPTGITGAITSAAGEVTWSLTGSTITWNVSPGAVLTTTFSISNTCPFADATKCPTATAERAYLGMPQASLKVDGFPNTMPLAGGLDVSGTWARLEGSVGNLTFEGNGVSNTQLVLWKGQRLDSFDASMVMPDLSSLNDGANFEFCGTFTIAIPKVVNKATNGCVRWSKPGFVLAQSGGATTVVTSIPTTDANGNTVAASADTAVKGLAWTNLPNASGYQIAFGGVANQLLSRTWTLSGLSNLPGAAASALGVDLKGASSLQFEVRGTFSSTELSVSGDIPVNIRIGGEPFKLDVRSIRGTLAASTTSGPSLSLGTSTDVTLGYAPSTRVITSSLSLVAATKPSTGMVLSLNAIGNKDSADSGVSGVTPASRLTRPDKATYIWPDQFGIRGLNLFSLAAEVGWKGGSPVVSYSSAAYLNPQGADMSKVLQCNGPCDPSDWMVSSLAVSASYTNPCLAYGFDGSAGGSSLAIDGGVMKTSVFKVGVAPTGCSIQSGGTTQSLPVGFVGFQFSATFGSSTLDVATQASPDGFVFQTRVTNFELAGMAYPLIALTVKIDGSGSHVSFDGQMTSALGTANVTSNFAGNTSGITQDLAASMTNWSMGRAGTMTVPSFEFRTSFSIPFGGGCADISASASGTMMVKSKTYRLKAASFRLTCQGLENLVLAIAMEHVKHGGGTVLADFTLQYMKNGAMGLPGRTLRGGASFSYDRRDSWRLEGRTFARTIAIGIGVSFSLTVGKESAADFRFGGSFDADRVSGSLGCQWQSDGRDFRCAGELRLNPDWAGVFRRSWGDL